MISRADFCICMLAFCFAARTNPAQSAIATEKPVVIALGDSITYGVRPNHSVVAEQTFVSRLDRALRPDFPRLQMINAGIPGNNTRDLLRRIDKDVVQKNPDLVLLMIGANDAAYIDAAPAGKGIVERQEPRVSPDEFRRNLVEILGRIKAVGAMALLVTPIPMTRAYLYSNKGYYRDHDINEALRDYVDIVLSVAASTHTDVIDVFHLWDADENYGNYLVDGIHPNPEGHAKLTNELVEKCRVLLAEHSK